MTPLTVYVGKDDRGPFFSTKPSGEMRECVAVPVEEYGKYQKNYLQKIPIEVLENEIRERMKRKIKAYEDALTWVGAIAVAPRESWPTHEVCASVCNEALALCGVE